MDFNSDSYIDVITGDRYGTISYFRRLPDGTLTEEADLVANGGTIDVGENSAPCIIDWNEDGLLDLLIGNDAASAERIRLYLNSGTPSAYLYTTYTNLQYTDNSYISFSRCNPHVTDLNNDGKKDLLIGEDWGHVYYLENVGTNTAPEFDEAVMVEANGVPISFPSGYTDLKVWANDWNEDGTKDLVVGNYDDSVHLYLAYPIGIKEDKRVIPDPVLSVRPNPASGPVVFHYQTCIAGSVSFTIYDIQGRKLRHLSSSNQNAGVHGVTWDGQDDKGIEVPAGVYFYRCTAGDRTIIDKLIIIR